MSLSPKVRAHEQRAEVSFVLGPAGSGKSHRFIEAARQRLSEAPEGPPLLYLAPKQATFQIESQLLNDSPLQGFTRLQVLSFPRLAENILSEFGSQQNEILSEDGRVMIVRSLLARHADELQAFHSVARLSTFADEVATLLVELHRHRLSSQSLRQLMASSDLSRSLKDKLHDLALLSENYLNWLHQAQLSDPEYLLEFATEQLNRLPREATSQPPFYVDELWMDGFAEMTPQELALLTAVVRHSRRANLAFCVDTEAEETGSWLDLWTTPREAFQKCRAYFDRHDDIETLGVQLLRKPAQSRFANSPALRHLEGGWNQVPTPSSSHPEPGAAVQVVSCKTREDETVNAARTILEFIRTKEARYRDIALLVRNLEDYSNEIRRVFTRYEIPYFVDQRTSVRHHPAIVLTRCTLRLAAHRWRTSDVLTALKTQLITNDLSQLSELENLVLEFGIDGAQWTKSIAGFGSAAARLEPFRQQVVQPFLSVFKMLHPPEAQEAEPVHGQRIVECIRGFWESCQLQDRLSEWDLAEAQDSLEQSPQGPTIHSSVWEALEQWLYNVELAFEDSYRSLTQWVGILEDGLSRLSVGVIPQTSDQVLIGSVDRTRSPHVKLAFVLGANEGVFPAAPKPTTLMTQSERDQLGTSFEGLFPSRRQELATERFYGYIACTRPSQQLVVSYAETTTDGSTLTPSSMIGHLTRLFPSLAIQRFVPPPPPAQTQHVSELIEPIFRALVSSGSPPEWMKDITALESHQIPTQGSLTGPETFSRLEPSIAAELYTKGTGIVRTSVSRLEQFAACPFRFFLHSGLRAEDRQAFEIDRRRIGSFQHLILELFHQRLAAQEKRWRDISTSEATQLIEAIATEVAPTFDHGLFTETAAAKFSFDSIVHRLKEFISIIIEWMAQYDFDPAVVELAFGGKQDDIEPWFVDLRAGRLAFAGKIDRLDLYQDEGEAEAIVIDYKSSGKQLDPVLLENGVQLQLLAYLNVVAQIPTIQKQIGLGSLLPRGVFFVPLSGGSSRQPNRDQALQNHTEHRPRAYQHVGCFDATALRHLDNRQDCLKGDQIQYHLKKDGTPRKTAWNVMSSESFQATMQRTETTIRDMGNRILAGELAVDPYQYGKHSACDYCPYGTVCRIEPESHEYRQLGAPGEQEDS